MVQLPKSNNAEQVGPVVALSISMNKKIFTYKTLRTVLFFSFTSVLVLTPLALSLTQGIGLSAAHAQAPAGEPSYWEQFWKWNNNINVFGSLLRPAFASIGALIIQLAVVILQIASGLFDILVTRTIIGFGASDGLLNQSVINAINVAWSAFRDLANILIVGFFTFIALNIILGSPTFGQKRLIANVLIVAILINFSLLFTKIIIDFSNYTATQFYIASVGRAPAAGAGGGAAAAPRSIGDRFIDLTKVTSLSDAAKSIDTVGSESGNWFMLLYAIVLFGIIMGAAAVLFYGSFILVSRAILLIFLMITAALAFATYLMPSNSPLNQWGTWWRSLIQSAVLAPILIIFLWATLRIAEGLTNIGTSSGTLGDLAKHPGTASNIGALFSYIIILALLFAAFKVASSFSMSIAGFNWASVMPAVTLAGGSRFAASTLRGGSWVAGQGLTAVGNRLNASNSRMATLGGGLLNATGKGLNAFSSKQLNLMNTPAGALAARQTGGITPQKVLAGAPRAPIGSSAASQRAAKAIMAAVTNKNKGTGTAVAKTPPTPPAGAATALPRPGAAALPAPKPAVPAGATPASGVHTATTDESTKVAAINKEAETRQEAAKATTEAIKENNKAVTEQLEKAVAGGGGAANDNTSKLLEKQAEANRTSMEKMTTELKEASAASSEKIGVELGKAASGIKEATTTTGAALTKSVEGVQEMAKRATELQTKQIEKSDDDKLSRDIEAERQHVASRKAQENTVQRRIETARGQAVTTTHGLANLRAKQAANDNYANDNTPPAEQPSSMGPMNASTAATARFAAQPYTQAGLSQPAQGIPLSYGAVDTDTLLKDIRINRERAAQMRRNGFKLIDGGKSDETK